MAGETKSLVISQTPYRISLGGGGTDLPFYSRERGGTLISATINQYLTVSVAKRPLDNKILTQTTTVQFADRLDDLKDNFIREALRYFDISQAVQIASFSTLPTNIGLGTSSTFMVGLVAGLSKLIGKRLSTMEIGSIAHYIEREILELSGGIQDQYIASLGGVQILKINTSGEVIAQNLMIKAQNLRELEKKLLLIYTGIDRDSTNIIKSQKSDIKKTLEVYDQIKELGHQSVDLLKNADIDGLGRVMNEHWEIKKTLSGKMSNSIIDKLYIKLKECGSPGGKIIGAGGGGFFIMAVPGDVKAYLSKIKGLGYRVLNWHFEFKGAHILESFGNEK